MPKLFPHTEEDLRFTVVFFLHGWLVSAGERPCMGWESNLGGQEQATSVHSGSHLLHPLHLAPGNLSWRFFFPTSTEYIINLVADFFFPLSQ